MYVCMYVRHIGFDLSYDTAARALVLKREFFSFCSLVSFRTEFVLPSTPFVRVLVRWAIKKGKRLTNRLPNLSLITQLHIAGWQACEI